MYRKSAMVKTGNDVFNFKENRGLNSNTMGNN